jgi:hypothetical protein
VTLQSINRRVRIPNLVVLVEEEEEEDEAADVVEPDVDAALEEDEEEDVVTRIKTTLSLTKKQLPATTTITITL